MNRKHFDALGHASEIVAANPKGILLTTKADGLVDSMVIGWGMLGTVWSTTTFVAFVRTSRFTHDNLASNPQFTIGVPVGGRLRPDILQVCGTQSARHVDKVAACGLTLVGGEKVDVPAILEAPLTLECEVIYHAAMDADAIPADLRERYYPQDVTDVDAGSSRYPHEVYYGRVVSSYLLEG